MNKDEDLLLRPPRTVHIMGVIRRRVDSLFTGGSSMEWTKPEFTVVAVTMEVTAYVATK